MKDNASNPSIRVPVADLRGQELTLGCCDLECIINRLGHVVVLVNASVLELNLEGLTWGVVAN